MSEFLSQVVSKVLSNSSDLSDIIFILPNQRAGVFLKKHLKSQLSRNTFLPEIITFDNFVEKINNISKTPSVELLFEFYNVYLLHTPVEKRDSFEMFTHWAKTVLDDFNDIDNNLIDRKNIFKTIREINQIQNWNPNTELTHNYLSFLQNLETYYDALYEHLLEKNKAYQGMLFREAVENLEHYTSSISKKHIFIGFSFLKKAESVIIQQLLEAQKAEIFWDVPNSFLSEKPFSHNFYESYFNNWSYYTKNSVQWIYDDDVTPEKIEITGVSKKVGMLKYLGQQLQNEEEMNNQAIILVDQNLLPITLQSLPETVKTINITMGIPLNSFPFSGLIQAFFELHLKQIQSEKGFYYQNILKVLQHPILFSLDNTMGKVVEDFIQYNKVFFSSEELLSLLNSLSSKFKDVLFPLFKPFDKTDKVAFLSALNNLIIFLKPLVDDIEREVIFQHYKLHQKLASLLGKYQYVNDLKGLSILYRQLIFSENLNFVGEPLEGLQLMGFLETQALDFKNLTLVSVNEGILPKNKKTESFIPFDVRKHYGLPTYQEEELAYSYLFNRLLQRAEKVNILYNTDNDTFGGGEKSRYITQLLWKYPQIKHNLADAQIPTYTVKYQEVIKTTEVIDKLKVLFQKGISPSTFSTYLFNPIDFYSQKILGIKEPDEIEETVAEKTLGTVVHGALEDIYRPFVGQFLSTDELEKSLSSVKTHVKNNFLKTYPHGNVEEGKNKLIFEVAVNFVNRFIRQEINELEEGNQIKIIGLEMELTELFTFDSLPFPVVFHGFIDRVDEINGTLRIIDYKTGKVESGQMKIQKLYQQPDDYKYSKALQVMLYSCMITKKLALDLIHPMQAGIISFKNHKSGFLPVNFGEKNTEYDYSITEFRQEAFLHHVENLLLEILNPEIPFTEKKP